VDPWLSRRQHRVQHPLQHHLQHPRQLRQPLRLSLQALLQVLHHRSFQVQHLPVGPPMLLPTPTLASRLRSLPAVLLIAVAALLWPQRQLHHSTPVLVSLSILFFWNWRVANVYLSSHYHCSSIHLSCSADIDYYFVHDWLR
jgi:hypothetical protein